MTSKIRPALLTLGSYIAGTFLTLAIKVFVAAGDTQVVDAILQAINRSLEAMTQSLSGAALIWRAIFTNGVNKPSLNFILNHLPELGQFLYDLIRPGSVLGRFPSTDGATETLDAEFPGIDNPYNELDLWLPENRNAVVCQAQRVTLTIVAILKMGRGKMPNGLDDVQLNVSLRSDFDANANPPSPTYISALHGGPPSPPNEKWLFINGIANEFFWFLGTAVVLILPPAITFPKSYCITLVPTIMSPKRISSLPGERRDGEPNTLIERTQSSKAAQEALEQELRAALWPAAGKVPGKVVMIAHSQGCLVLRLALQTLATETPKGSPQRRIIKERLRIFTFGNPSIDWKVIDGTEQPLSKYVHTTEHFANETDFVAMLGVVMHRDDKGSGYDPNMVFYSKTGKAHLFGAHYSLGVNAYHGGEKSQLLKAVNGTEIA
ncbi:hypothetical protein FOXG_16762 [Fusarium oxysporum f. sp. lycopersici 4287]|uniref:DUF676 domain-containing protein n=3 Tax=Fusarium oxysporum TaxID=5507 RepID=A0A0J9W9E7_FUSO4|nr:hypothetical protein FOXG_16762 [Fusarium oxysporum f. sp. lycopersici 4287]KNB19498.1 hypothetical protein FOXG_16762 [Fusarium oxysporum f. sp. lycopersici 4287]